MSTKFRSVRFVVVLLLGAVLAACYRPVASDAPYVAVVYQPQEITFEEGLVYGVGIDEELLEIELKLDIFLPPDLVPSVDPTDPIDAVPEPTDPIDAVPGVARPTLMLVHGGGFLFGDRSDFHEEARAWAQRGYVVATPSYRLVSQAPADGFRDVGPGLDAAADGQLAVKWLRANADTYGIDTDRIAVIGSSAGGVVALGTGLSIDLTDDSTDRPDSHVANAVISTGAPFAPFIEQEIATSETIAAPAVMHHYEADWVTGFTGEETKFTCLIWSTEPSPHDCLPVIIEGTGHTLGIGPEAFLAERVYHPFLAAELDLANAPDPRPDPGLPTRPNPDNQS